MQNILRPAAFVLISSNHGTMIVNRNDYRLCGSQGGYGVGYQIMQSSAFDPAEVDLALGLLAMRREHHGDGVIAIDCGANIGVHTVEWARSMHGWGYVHAFEAQERLYYALAGNIAINNCFNASAYYAAVGATQGTLTVPEPNYLVPSSFGSLGLRPGTQDEFIGQTIDYAGAQKRIPLVPIDSLGLPRVDFIKIDVEGMEEDVLAGAAQTISRSLPVLLIEIIKSDPKKVLEFLGSRGYRATPLGINVLAIHGSDPIANRVAFEERSTQPA